MLLLNAIINHRSRRGNERYESLRIRVPREK